MHANSLIDQLERRLDERHARRHEEIIALLLSAHRGDQDVEDVVAEWSADDGYIR